MKHIYSIHIPSFYLYPIRKLRFLFSCCLLLCFAITQAQTTYTNNTSVSIPDDTGVAANSSITSSLTGVYGVDYIITNVTVDIFHDYNADIILNLISPDGTILVLSSHNGGTSDDYTNTEFEAGGGDITVATGPFTGSFEPQGGAFNDVFNGENVNGDWTLSVYDNWNLPTTTQNIDSFSITFGTPPACSAPVNVSASPLNATSANVYWSNVNAAVNGYDWVLMAEGEDPDTDTPIAQNSSPVFTNTANLTGLTTGTNYDFFVRSNCGGAGSPSNWSSRERFSLSQNYCDGTDFYDNGGQNANYTNSSFESTTISPLISSNKVSVTFNSFATEEGFDGLLIYDGPNTNAPLISSGYVSPNTGSVPDGAWTGTGTYSANGQTFTSTHPTGTLTFFFRSNAVTTDTGWEATIDCGTAPSCEIPDNFSATNINVTSVDLSWDATSSGENGGYEYLLVSDGSIPDAGTTPTGSVETGITAATVSGLQQTTTYDAYVRSVCQPDPGGDRSEWTAAQTFTTLTSCVAPQNLTASNVTAFTADLDWDATVSGESEGYEYVIISDGSIPDASTTPDGSVASGVTSLNLTGLNADTTYNAYVRAYCSSSPDDISAWSIVETFTTDISCFTPENLSVSNITATTADLSWDETTSIISEGYEWVLMPSGDAPDIANSLLNGSTDETTSIANISSLSEDTTYDAYVRAECSPGDYSDWSIGVTFSTTCLPKNLPWSEGFEGVSSVASNVYPECWTDGEGTISTEDDDFFGIVARTGSQFISSLNGSSNVVYTPGFDLNASETYEFSFWYRTSDNQPAQSFEIFVGTNLDYTGMTSLGGNPDAQNTNYIKFSENYSPATSDIYYFAIQAANPANTLVAIGFDDFSLYKITDYSYSGGSFLPSNPSGVNQPQSTLSIESGTAILNNPTTLDTITVKPGAVLKPGADITANFKFESDLTGSGQFGNTEGHSINGSARVENFIPAKRAFRSIAPTVSGVSVADSWQQQIHVTGSGGVSNGFDQTQTNNPSMFEFNHTLNDQSDPWVSIPNTNHILQAGHPYYLMVRGDRNTDLTSNNPPASDVTLSADGTLHTGVFNVETSDYPDNFTLVGNPYQAVVDLSSLNYGADVNDTFAYYWDPEIGSIGDYVEITIADGSIDPSSSDADNFLRPGQAVFIQNNSSGSDFSIQFNESAKNTNGTQTQVFSSTSDQTYINMRIYTQDRYLNNQSEEDALGLRFSDNANNATDNNDAAKLFNNGINLARVDDDNNFISIEYRSLPQDNEVLDLYINNLLDDDYILYLEVENFENTQQVSVIDIYANQIHTLEQGINTIDFTADASVPESVDSHRFQLLFENESFGTDDASLADNIILYPVPANKQLNINNTLSLDLDITIFSSLGQKVIRSEINQNEFKTLNIDNISSGVYLVRLSNEDKVFYKKIVKE